MFKAMKTPEEMGTSLNIRDCKLKANVLESVLVDIVNDGDNRPLRFFALSKHFLKNKKSRLPRVKKMTEKNKKVIKNFVFEREKKLFKYQKS